MTFKKIRFVTDSTCDITPELLAKHNITVVPCYINYDNKSFADDGKQLSREEFYTNLPSMRPAPTTAAPSPGDCKSAIESAAADADHVIIVTVASKLSGTYNALRLGAADLPPDRVTLIDGETMSMGIGWPVVIGAEVAEATGDVEKTVETVKKVREHAHLYAGLQTMEYLRRSGRVSWATAGIGALLQIKPVLLVKNGEVISASRVRTFARVTDELVRFANSHAPLERLTVLHALNPEGAVELRNRLADIAPADTIITSITPTIGTHIGPGGLGVVTVSKSWRTT